MIILTAVILLIAFVGFIFCFDAYCGLLWPLWLVIYFVLGLVGGWFCCLIELFYCLLLRISVFRMFGLLVWLLGCLLDLCLVFGYCFMFYCGLGLIVCVLGGWGLCGLLEGLLLVGVLLFLVLFEFVIYSFIFGITLTWLRLDRFICLWVDSAWLICGYFGVSLFVYDTFVMFFLLCFEIVRCCYFEVDGCGIVF